MTTLKRLRAEARLTQAAMADALGVGLDHYRNLESGRKRVRKVYILAAERLAETASKPQVTR